MSAASVPPGELRLEVVSGKAAGEKVIVEDRLVFGRQTAGPGRLAGDPELSRHHAEVARDASGSFAIRDLASTNGTFVNGVRVDELTVLATGDVIDLGTTRLIVRGPPIAGAPAVDVRAATLIVEAPSGPPPVAPAEGPPPVAPVEEPTPVAPVKGPPPVGPVEEPTPVAPVEEPTPVAAVEEATSVASAERTEAEEAPAVVHAVAGAPRLELRVIVDFERREAEIELEGGSEPVRLRSRDGRWQTPHRGS